MVISDKLRAVSGQTDSAPQRKMVWSCAALSAGQTLLVALADRLIWPTSFDKMQAPQDGVFISEKV